MAKRTKRRGTGEGGIEELPSGKWRAILCRTDHAGKRVRSSKSFPTKREALDWLDANRQAGPVQAGTFGDWLTTWLELHKTRVGAAAYHTDSGMVERHLRPGLGLVKLRDLTPLRCQTFLASISALSQSQRHKIGRTLRMACHAAEKAGTMPHSPMRRTSITPAPKPNTRAMTPEEVEAVIQAADDLGHGPLFRLWTETGLRPGELLALQWRDLDGGELFVRRSVEMVTGELKEPKTAAGRRKITLSPATASAIESSRAASESPLVPTQTGLHWRHQNFLKAIFDPVMKKAGVKGAIPYLFRHTMATSLLARGHSLNSVAERLGHKDPALTLRVYGHAMPGDSAKAAETMAGLFPTLDPRPESGKSKHERKPNQ